MAGQIDSEFNQVKALLVNEWKGIIDRDRTEVEKTLVSQPHVSQINRTR